MESTNSERIDEYELTEDFFSRPTLEEIEKDYRWNQEEHPNILSSQKYETGKLIWYFKSLLRPFFDKVGSNISVNTSDRFVQIAQDYSEMDNIDSYGHLNYPMVAAQFSRLCSLINQPEFISNPVSVRVMLKLKDLPICTNPFDFEMWESYDQSTNKYHLIPGFGSNQVEGLSRLVYTNDIWTGENREMKRMFFCSVVGALKHLSKDNQIETLRPRVDLLLRNKQHGEHHEPWCHGSFEEEEIKNLEKTANHEPALKHEIMENLEKIYSNGLKYHVHIC